MPEIRFLPVDRSVTVEAGTALLDAAAKAGLTLSAPCGGEGTCGQCRVRIEAGSVDSVRRGCLAADEIAEGIVLACSSRVTGDLMVRLLEENQSVAGRIVTDAAGHRVIGSSLAAQLPRPAAARKLLKLAPPGPGNVLSDMGRLIRVIQAHHPVTHVTIGLHVLRSVASAIRAQDGEVTVTLAPAWPGSGGIFDQDAEEVISVEPGDTIAQQLGLAIDVGTTTCAVRLVELATGRIVGTAADYNAQLARGADVISRINYARLPERLEELRQLVLGTLNALIAGLCRDHGRDPAHIDNVVIVGNTTMMHLLLGLPPEHIRLAPYTPTLNCPPMLRAREVGLSIYPETCAVFAPAVGSYVGGDITAGLLQTALAGDSDEVRLFLDFGTNGEVVIGNSEWLMACAASAGPAFEGGGVSCGMRAMAGAIESVHIDPETLRPAVSVIGGGRPQGICGSGLVDLLSELLSVGLIDPSGKLDPNRGGDRVRPADDSGRNPAYTVVPAAETGTGRAITIDGHDIANLLRTKAAVYSACAVMLKSVDLDFDAVVEVYVAGGFGRYLNLEKSISIGLLPDLPPERFTYLGNAALTGAHAMLCDEAARSKVRELAGRITYLELNTEPGYMSEYTAAMFLPHTDIDRFPSAKRRRTAARGALR